LAGVQGCKKDITNRVRHFRSIIATSQNGMTFQKMYEIQTRNDNLIPNSMPQ